MLAPGTQICGKWSQARYEVQRPLGEGANGQVYLVMGDGAAVAMKVCDRAEDAALEWGILERVGTASAWFPKPIRMDDDRDRPGLYFYLMESVKGVPMSDVLSTLDGRRLHEAISQTLCGIDTLHQLGYAFCDVKPENLLLDVGLTGDVSVRFVDIGGVTAFGRSVRQFTPFYDRAFWMLGSRKADAGYDLCGCALVFLFSLVSAPPKEILGMAPDSRRAWLERAIHKVPQVALQSWLLSVLEGTTNVAAHALQSLPPAGQLEHRGNRGSMGKAAKRKKSVQAQLSKQAIRPVRPARKRSNTRDWTEWVMWASLGTAAVVSIGAWTQLLR